MIGGTFDYLLLTLMFILALSLALTTWQLIRSPSIPDRALAFDVIMTHVVGLIALYSITVGEDLLVDAVIIVAVLGFLSTVAIARYIEKGRQ